MQFPKIETPRLDATVATEIATARHQLETLLRRVDRLEQRPSHKAIRDVRRITQGLQYLTKARLTRPTSAG